MTLLISSKIGLGGWNRITLVPPANIQALPDVWVSVKEAGQLSINLGAANP